MAFLSLKNPEILLLNDGLELFYGADQEWYGKIWQRRAGCGPTVASMLAWYLSQTRGECRALSDKKAASKEGFIGMMDDMWKHVTPGYRGVNATAIFKRGLSEYAALRDVDVVFSELDIDFKPDNRPDGAALGNFMVEAMERDRPVAFLNLHNGEEVNLDRWHWVTLVSYDSQTGQAVMYDQGKESRIDLLLWLRTTRFGGGLLTADTQ